MVKAEIGHVMIKVLFFARLREQLGVNEMQIESVEGESVLEFATRISAQQTSDWDVLVDEETVYAINQEIVERDAIVPSFSEVAFFPPVTGG